MTLLGARFQPLIVLLFLISGSLFAIPRDIPHRNDPCFVPKYLSLQDAIALALRNNPQIRSAELQRTVDRFTLEVARNQFLPQYSFDASATYSNGTKPYYSTNPKTTWETPYGTMIGLGLADQVNRGRETAAFVEVTQPLLRGGGPRVVQAAYLSTFQQELINRLNLQDTIMATVTHVVQEYYKLVQDYNHLQIAQSTLVEALKTLHATNLRIKAGKLAGTEIIQQETQIATLRMSLIRENNLFSQDYRSLLILLGLDPRSDLKIDTHIKIRPNPLPSPSEAIEIALCNNIEYQRSLLKLKQLELALLVAKNEQQWKLDLVGRAQQELIRNKDFATINIDKLDAIGNDKPGGDRTLVVNLNIPIHDVTRKQTIVRARIALRQFNIELETQRRQLIAAVMNSLQNLQTQLTQIQLASDAMNYSQKSVEIAQKKFMYGRSTMFEVTSLQRTYMLQQLALVSEKISYVDNEVLFQSLLGITLEKWCIKFHE
ncbi:MAG: TolC family protein [Gammaproteobacteria bacterium]|nr:TolC family protein [Gammaproteobacteria bacterium]